ncbi:MAG: hypothetical protein GY714_25645 [Desulfobacterales bacterium]|nr:hypothetical protein [Desulfobacterales bacterium]
MIKDYILKDIVKHSARCEITTDMISKSDAIHFDEYTRIDLWLNEEIKNIPEDERHSIVKDQVFKKPSLNYGIYKIRRTCC